MAVSDDWRTVGTREAGSATRRRRASSTALSELRAAATWAGIIAPDFDSMLALCNWMRKRRPQALPRRLHHAHARRKNPSQPLFYP